MKLKIVLAILLFASLGGFVLFFGPGAFNKEPVLADLETGIGIHIPGSEKYLLRKNFLREGGDGSVRSLEAVRGEQLLRIEVMRGLSIDDSRKTVDERLNMISSLYSNLPSPYPGAVTNQVDVPAELRPIVRMLKGDEGERPLYILSSNSRYTYGAMSKEIATFRGGLAFIYDENSLTLYRVDLYIPWQEFDEEELAGFFEGIRPAGKDSGTSPGQDRPKMEDEVPEKSDLVRDVNSLRKPGYNLIIIAFEPLGADHVSSYGYSKKTTPNLDAFASEAFLFENASSPSSWSLPVFMSWFTSLYPSQHKVINKYSKYTETEQVLADLAKLSPGAVTMPELLRDNDYRTAAFTGGASLAGDFGFRAGFDEYYDKTSFGGFDRTMPLAIDWLNKSSSPDKFFLFVQGYDVHGKFPLERKYLDRFLDEPYSGSSKGTEDEYWALRNKNLDEGVLSLTEDETLFWKGIYDAKIFAADQRFGLFIDKLRQMGLHDKSIIIVSSGSGNEYLQHGGIDHGFSLYEELLHVPLLIRIPGAGGKRVKGLVRTLDLMPTVIDLLGIRANGKVSSQMQGVSLLPLMDGESLALDAVAETDYLSRVFKRSIRTHDGWKLIVSLDSEKRELYDLNNDPGEKKDLAGAEPRRTYELEQNLFRTLKGR